jgi:hypothetical protein
MGAKAAKQDRIEIFLRDLAYLEEVERYLNQDIADRMGIHPTNLSSYKSGTKRPGEETINKFYMTFAEELNNDPGGGHYDSNSASDSNQDKAEEPSTDYARAQAEGGITGKLVNTLITTNERLWKDKEELRADKERLWKEKDQVWASFREMYTSDRKTIHALVRNNTVLVNKVSPRRGSSNNSSSSE